MTPPSAGTLHPRTEARPTTSASHASATRTAPQSAQETPGIARIECVVRSTADTASLDRLRHAIMSGTAGRTCHDARARARRVLSDVGTTRGNREVGDAQSA